MSELARIVVVGASAAGFHAAEAIRREGFEGRLVLVGAETDLPYDRTALSKDYLLGEVDSEAITLKSARSLDAEWMLGAAATETNFATRRLTLASGEVLDFDGLVVATGLAPRRLPMIDSTQPGVHELRNIADADSLRAALATRPEVVVVGSGFIGMEAASICRQMGLEVTVVSATEPLFPFGSLVSETCRASLIDHGVSFISDCPVAGVARDEGTDEVRGILLEDGRLVQGDVILMAVGSVPATGWLRSSGLAVDHGVVADKNGRVIGVDNVVAAGDLALMPTVWAPDYALRIEHWNVAIDQGRTAGASLVRGRDWQPGSRAVPSFSSEHFGLQLQSVGLPTGADRMQLVEGSAESRSFVVELYRRDELIGALGYNAQRSLIRYMVQLRGVASA